jgi:hypothetical protein
MILSSLRLCAAIAAVGLPILLAPQTASAATVDVWVDDAVVFSPLSTFTGSLDVYVTSAVSTPIFSYNTEVSLSPTGGGVIFLTPAWDTTAHTPAFPGPAGFFNSTTATVIQVAHDTNPAINLDNNEGLFRINYQVAPGTLGVFNLDFTQALSNIFDSNNQPVDAVFHGGTITVVAVPEPASLTILGVAGALLLKRRRRVA